MYGGVLRKIRKEKGIKQEVIAEYLSLSQKAYSKLENNQTKLTLEKFLCFCEFTQIKPQELILQLNG